MIKLKLLSSALIAAAVLTSPAMARERHVTSPLAADAYTSTDAYASTMPDARYINGPRRIPAPRVGQFASQPWDNDIPCEPAPAY
jgi:hypothetical protein